MSDVGDVFDMAYLVQPARKVVHAGERQGKRKLGDCRYGDNIHGEAAGIHAGSCLFLREPNFSLDRVRQNRIGGSYRE